MPHMLVCLALCVLACPALAGAPSPLIEYKPGEAIVGVEGLVVSNAGVKNFAVSPAGVVSGRAVLSSVYRRSFRTEPTEVLIGQSHIFTAPDHRVFTIKVHQIGEDGRIIASFSSRPPASYRTLLDEHAAKR